MLRPEMFARQAASIAKNFTMGKNRDLVVERRFARASHEPVTRETKSMNRSVDNYRAWAFASGQKALLFGPGQDTFAKQIQRRRFGRRRFIDFLPARYLRRSLDTSESTLGNRRRQAKRQKILMSELFLQPSNLSRDSTNSVMIKSTFDDLRLVKRSTFEYRVFDSVLGAR